MFLPSVRRAPASPHSQGYEKVKEWGYRFDTPVMSLGQSDLPCLHHFRYLADKLDLQQTVDE
jgi:hypothetical protein